MNSAANGNGAGRADGTGDHSKTPVISVRNVTKVYLMGDVEVFALNGVDLDIWPGEMTAIMGPSGSGKSTLMNIIGCLDVPTGGTYMLDGVDVHQLKDDELAAIRCTKIGFVFQNFNLLPRTTALANVELPLIYSGTGGRIRRNRAEEALRRVGLGERMHHRPNELSGGQQQRVAIARALAMSPSLVLADEPTGNLDTHSADDVFALLREVNTRLNTTFLIVTHDRRLAARCDRIIEMVDGDIVADTRHQAATN